MFVEPTAEAIEIEVQVILAEAGYPSSRAPELNEIILGELARQRLLFEQLQKFLDQKTQNDGAVLDGRPTGC